MYMCACIVHVFVCNILYVCMSKLAIYYHTSIVFVFLENHIGLADYNEHLAPTCK